MERPCCDHGTENGGGGTESRAAARELATLLTGGPRILRRSTEQGAPEGPKDDARGLRSPPGAEKGASGGREEAAVVVPRSPPGGFRKGVRRPPEAS